jgi:ribonuclease J
LDEDVPLPDVPGLGSGSDPNLLGILLSHTHLDHMGLVSRVPEDVPVFMGEAASRILREASFFTPLGTSREPTGFLRHRETIELGPFQLTSFLNDHSAFDAYSLLIEAGGRRLFYTGDIRGHGRKRGLFEELLQHPPADVDVLLMEGTHIGPHGDPETVGPSETDVEDDCASTMRGAEGMVLALYSPQNIDRLVTLYRAALRAGRLLVMDLYTAQIARATGRSTIPQASWENVLVYLPRSQRARVIADKAFEKTESIRGARIYPEDLAPRRRELVLTFRHSMTREVEAAGCLEGASAIWSMWPGYLKETRSAALLAFLERHRIPLLVHHSSGHAFLSDLQRLAQAIKPTRVVPIHTSAGDRYAEFFPGVDRKTDGEWWEV